MILGLETEKYIKLRASLSLSLTADWLLILETTGKKWENGQNQ